MFSLYDTEEQGEREREQEEKKGNLWEKKKNA